MKKTVVILLLFLAISARLEASSADGRTTHGPMVRPFMVLSRGVVNVAGLPFAAVNTAIREVKIHHWLWPISVGPRVATEFVTRLTSAGYDMVLMPLITPFTDDISPLTEPFGLPPYPWQQEL